MQDDIKKIIHEYSENYCLFLEATYGSCMMSEGGAQAIDNMLESEKPYNKRLLDIGFGLGGVPFYLAEKYKANVAGVEINPWMVEEAQRRTPNTLKAQIEFKAYHPDSTLPFEDSAFDIVFSKGVLTHLNDKTNVFQEVRRVLKPKGVFIIDDWLSPTKRRWGERLQKMCDAENLTLYAETEENYTKLLEQAGFSAIAMHNENTNYHRYNLDIVSRLNNEKLKEDHNPAFDEFSIDEAIESYQLIADSIRDNELLIRRFRAIKIG